jgi:Tfp pilus assembly protein FimT
MLVVASLLAITSVIVVPASLDASGMAASDAAARIQADLSYAQSRAILLRSPHSFVCNMAQGYYHLATAQAPSTPITDPISRKPHRVFLRAACENAALRTTLHVESLPQAALSSVSFDGGTVLTFDAMGLPWVGSTPLASGKIEIDAGSCELEIVVDAVTGRASIQEPSNGQQSPSGSEQEQGGLLAWLFGGWDL